MPTKEATFSENARSSYRMFLDKHILPVLGDVLLVEVSPAMISKLLIDFQRAGYAHATTVKLYNILNGIFEMAFLDDSIPMNPMLKVKRPAPQEGRTAQRGKRQGIYCAGVILYPFLCRPGAAAMADIYFPWLLIPASAVGSAAASSGLILTSRPGR